MILVRAGLDLIPLTIILVAVATSGIIVSRIKQPLLVGYIIAGLILGPAVLGLTLATDSLSYGPDQ